ncbi:EAL domain-containing protein [Larsenimonas rhizosphaerae]|nr:EAL domain-containing protein [Larsenimonas rhizosphaerae]MCM2132169.1 EAL domain-containing protein [Larsenimonas rhizosphaerae]
MSCVAPAQCLCHQPLGFDIVMAFQPIVDLGSGHVHAHEALVRGVNGEGAGDVLAQVDEKNIYQFDQRCRTQSLRQIAALGSTVPVSINFMPNAVYEPEACLASTIATARRLGWDLRNIIFEITETEHVRDQAHLAHIVSMYRQMGLAVALDDFGAGNSNLETLTYMHPDYLKLDRSLIGGVCGSTTKQNIVDAMLSLASAEHINVVAEGVEAEEDAHWLYQRGIRLQQGYFFARPAVDGLPDVYWPDWVGC